MSAVTEALTSGNTPKAISTLVENSPQLWKCESISDKDVETFYFQLTYFLTAPEFKVGEELRKSVIDLVTSGTSRPNARISVLNHMYNSGTGVALKFALLEAIIRLAIETKQADVVDAILQDLDRLLAQWSVSDAERSRVHHLLSILLADTDPWISHVHRMKWFESFKSTSDCEEVAAELTQAMIAALNRPDVFQYQTLCSAPAASVVSKSNPDLIKLAHIYTNGLYKDFVEFSKSTSLFSNNTLSLEVASTKSRILTLVSLAQEKSTVSYQSIATALDVPLEDAEQWALDAIAEGLLDAKLDHLSSSILVSYAFRREFGDSQWVDLHNKLGKWMENIKGMITVIRDARSQTSKQSQHNTLKQGLLATAQ